MKVGFIGAGNVTHTIGRHLITAGHTIVVSNSRGPETLTDLSLISVPTQLPARNNRPPNVKLLFWLLNG
jgi:predicted dinucleotide-binding enzyme